MSKKFQIAGEGRGAGEAMDSKFWGVLTDLIYDFSPVVLSDSGAEMEKNR